MTNIKFSELELMEGSSVLKIKRSPGPYHIPFELIKNLQQNAINHLFIYKLNWQTQKFPEKWMETQTQQSQIQPK